jgi:hypothetical protein
MHSTSYLSRCCGTHHGHISIDTTQYEADRRTINMLFQKSKMGEIECNKKYINKNVDI